MLSDCRNNCGDVSHGFDQAVGVTHSLHYQANAIRSPSITCKQGPRWRFAASYNIGGNNGLVRDCQDAGEIVHQGGLAEEIINFSTVVLRFTRKVKSVTEPVIVGTRRAIPSNKPLSSGIVSVVAMAAPVLVGTMF